MVLPLSWTNPKLDYSNLIFSFDCRSQNTFVERPLEAAIKTVLYIRDNYPSPYIIYLSGGIDSQAMLYAWHLSNIPFQTHTAVYNNDLNKDDYETIVQFGEKLNIKINLVPFDLFSFLDTEHEYYAKTFLTGSPQFTSFMKIVSQQKKGTAIMSGDFLRPNVDYNHFINFNKPKIISYTGIPDKNAMGLLHFAIKSNLKFVPWFFLETEMLAHSFYRYPNLDIAKKFNISKTFINSKYGNYFYKTALYQENEFPVIPQTNIQRGKYNGFEMVKTYFDEQLEMKKSKMNREELQEFEKYYRKLLLIKTSHQHSKRWFDLLYRNKYETVINSISYNFRMNNL